MNLTSLTSHNRRDLARCEKTIERGLTTFIEVGKALAEIRDKYLYRETHVTFQEYCTERWGLERRRAYQLMDAAQAAENVNHGTHADGPANERQAREIARLPQDQQAGCWQDIVRDCGGVEKVTAAKVKMSVDLWLADNEPYVPDEPDRNRPAGGDDDYDHRDPGAAGAEVHAGDPADPVGDEHADPAEDQLDVEQREYEETLHKMETALRKAVLDVREQYPQVHASDFADWLFDLAVDLKTRGTEAAAAID
jgi:hypothetical protein